MRITIADPTTKRFTKMIEVFTIDPCNTNDNVIYVQDGYGSWITLTFQTKVAKESALSDLRLYGSTTAYCYFEYYIEEPQYTDDEHDREIDINNLCERFDIWGYEYDR